MVTRGSARLSRLLCAAAACAGLRRGAALTGGGAAAGAAAAPLRPMARGARAAPHGRAAARARGWMAARRGRGAPAGGPASRLGSAKPARPALLARLQVGRLRHAERLAARMRQRRIAAGAACALALLALAACVSGHAHHEAPAADSSSDADAGATGRAALAGDGVLLAWTLRNDSVSFHVTATQKSLCVRSRAGERPRRDARPAGAGRRA
jgi:hypothetical protein